MINERMRTGIKQIGWHCDLLVGIYRHSTGWSPQVKYLPPQDIMKYLSKTDTMTTE